MNGNAQSEAVEHGHNRKHGISGAEHGVCGDNLCAEGVKIVVGKQNSLGNAGGAAAVKDNRRVARVAHRAIFPVVVPSLIHKVVPNGDGGVLRDFLDFSSLGEHISGTDGL